MGQLCGKLRSYSVSPGFGNLYGVGKTSSFNRAGGSLEMLSKWKVRKQRSSVAYFLEKFWCRGFKNTRLLRKREVVLCCKMGCPENPCTLI